MLKDASLTGRSCSIIYERLSSVHGTRMPRTNEKYKNERSFWEEEEDVDSKWQNIALGGGGGGIRRRKKEGGERRGEKDDDDNFLSFLSL